MGRRITAEEISRLAVAFTTVCWEFPDLDARIYLSIEVNPPNIRIVPSIDGQADLRVVVDDKVLHDAAHGGGSLGAAFISGRLKVYGLNPLHLSKFVLLTKPMLDGYRDAEE